MPQDHLLLSDWQQGGTRLHSTLAVVLMLLIYSHAEPAKFSCTSMLGV